MTSQWITPRGQSKTKSGKADTQHVKIWSNTVSKQSKTHSKLLAGSTQDVYLCRGDFAEILAVFRSKILRNDTSIFTLCGVRHPESMNSLASSLQILILHDEGPQRFGTTELQGQSSRFNSRLHLCWRSRHLIKTNANIHFVSIFRLRDLATRCHVFWLQAGPEPCLLVYVRTRSVSCTYRTFSVGCPHILCVSLNCRAKQLKFRKSQID